MTGNKKAARRIPWIKQSRHQTPRKTCDPLKIPDQQQIATYLDMQIQEVRTPSECIRIKGKVHVHIK